MKEAESNGGRAMVYRDFEYGRQGWYPADEAACRRQIERFVADRNAPTDPAGTWHGGIVPHAGWSFSGQTAAGVFSALSAERPDTVVVFGHHAAPGSRSTIMADGGWKTPLGDLETDVELVEAITGDAPAAPVSADRFRTDNTIELQLPFVKYTFPDARLVAVGAAPNPDVLVLADRIAEAATALGRSILVVGSTDLTHYGPNYGFAPAGSGDEAVVWVRDVNDRGAIDRMLALDPAGLIDEALAHHNACCPGAAAAAIRAGLALGATRAVQTAYATSNDLLPGSSFVGYTGIVF